MSNTFTICATELVREDGRYKPGLHPAADDKARIGWRLGTFQAVTDLSARVSFVGSEWFLIVDNRTVAQWAGKLYRAEAEINEALHLVWQGWSLRVEQEWFEAELASSEEITSHVV